MHRQPENVWRIDYQVGDDEDPEEAVKPENVLPRVQSHLDMIGETAPWKPLWISIYNAKCLTLRSEEHTSALQSLMRISSAVFCLKKKKKYNKETHIHPK